MPKKDYGRNEHERNISKKRRQQKRQHGRVKLHDLLGRRSKPETKIEFMGIEK